MSNNHQPIATFFAGVNGCGKTTFYYDELEKSKNFGLRINIDEMVSSFGSWREPQDQIRATKIAITMRNTYIKERADFNQETTLCGKSILNLFKDLKKQGYRINLYYISVNSVKTAIERVAMRVSKGGHNVDSALIEKRFYESRKNLATISSYCDSTQCFENSSKKFMPISLSEIETDFDIQRKSKIISNDEIIGKKWDTKPLIVRNTPKPKTRKMR